MLFELLRWWYGAGWISAIRNVAVWPHRVQRHFSMPILIKTLFSPWKRIVTIPGRSFDAKVRAALDNLVSRVIGLVVRVMVILFATVMMASAFMLAIVMAIIWPLLPPGVIFLIFKGVTS